MLSVESCGVEHAWTTTRLHQADIDRRAERQGGRAQNGPVDAVAGVEAGQGVAGPDNPDPGGRHSVTDAAGTARRTAPVLEARATAGRDVHRRHERRRRGRPGSSRPPVRRRQGPSGRRSARRWPRCRSSIDKRTGAGRRCRQCRCRRRGGCKCRCRCPPPPRSMATEPMSCVDQGLDSTYDRALPLTEPTEAVTVASVPELGAV